MELFVSDINGRIYGVDTKESNTANSVCSRMGEILHEVPLQHGKLVLSSGKQLEGHKTLKEQGVRSNDQLLYIPVQSKDAIVKQSESMDEGRHSFLEAAPTEEIVGKCTSSITASSKERSGFAGGLLALLNDMTFHRRMRQALICLVNVALRLQSLNSDDEESSESDGDDDGKQMGVNEDDLKQLTEMGFSVQQATKALLLNKSCLQAMEWLIQHQDDANTDEPFPATASEDVTILEPTSVTSTATVTTTTAGTPTTAAATNSITMETVTDAMSKDDVPTAEVTDTSDHGISKNLSPVRTKKHLKKRKWEFTPDRAAVYKLKQMGFQEEEVMDALRVCNNNESAACEWLLGDRIPGPGSVDLGLTADSDEYKDIFKEPAVYLGLMSSRNLKILEDIIQNQPLLTQYLSDQELGPLLLHVARIVLDKPSSRNAVV